MNTLVRSNNEKDGQPALYVLYMLDAQRLASSLNAALSIGCDIHVVLLDMGLSYTMPTAEVPILLIWSPRCGQTQQKDLLRKFDPEVATGMQRRLLILNTVLRSKLFLDYLKNCGAYDLSIGGGILHIAQECRDARDFTVKTVSRESSFGKYIVSNCGSSGHGDWTEAWYELSNVLPWLKQEYMTKRRTTGDAREE